MTSDRGRVRLLNAAALVGVPLCLVAGGFELSRALAGNSLSWVYTVEWPLIGGYAVVIWRQLVHEQTGQGRAKQTAARRPGPRPPADPAPDDPGLRAWEDYLSRLHTNQPPGGPPRRDRGS